MNDCLSVYLYLKIKVIYINLLPKDLKNALKKVLSQGVEMSKKNRCYSLINFVHSSDDNFKGIQYTFVVLIYFYTCFVNFIS